MPPPPQGRRKQILIVDPNPGSLARLRGVLESLGYRAVGGGVREATGLARGLKLTMAFVDGATAGSDLDHLTSLLRRAAVPVIVLHPAEEPPPTVAGAVGHLATPWRTADLVTILYRYAGDAV